MLRAGYGISIDPYSFTVVLRGNYPAITNSQYTGANGFTGCYTLGSGENNNTGDAGFYKTATIGDHVWNDTNGNGIQDAGETGKSGVTVQLYTCGVGDQPGTLEHLEMLGNGGERDGIGRGDLGNGFLAAGDIAKDGAAGGVREGVEEGVKVGRAVNHMVECYRKAGPVSTVWLNDF